MSGIEEKLDQSELPGVDPELVLQKMGTQSYLFFCSGQTSHFLSYERSVGSR